MSEATDRAFPDQYMLRLPPGMRDALKAMANAGGRTLNVEIVARLQRSLDTVPTEAEDPVARAAALADALERIARAAETIARHQPGAESFPT